MERSSCGFKIAAVLGLAVLALGVMSRPADAGLFGRRTVVVATPGYPAVVAPAPVATVYTAPVTTVVARPVTTIYSAPVLDPAVVPSTYTTSTVASAPVATTYTAPAVVTPAPRVRVVYPRRVYRYGY